MPQYTFRTHPDYTLTLPEHGGKTYRNGDSIALPEARAREIAYDSKWHRFEREDGRAIGEDRHRSGRIPPPDSDQAPPKPGADTQ